MRHFYSREVHEKSVLAQKEANTVYTNTQQIRNIEKELFALLEQGVNNKRVDELMIKYIEYKLH